MLIAVFDGCVVGLCCWAVLDSCAKGLCVLSGYANGCARERLRTSEDLPLRAGNLSEIG